ncbi:MAG: NINE protein [Raineya sp.]
MKSRVVSAILSFVLGGWGVQHFYLGNVGKGVLSVIFSWTFIPTIIGIVEGIKFIAMSDEEFNAKYNAPKSHLTNLTGLLLELNQNKLNYQSQFTNQNVADELEKLANLMDRGLITFEEFERRKKKILG